MANYPYEGPATMRKPIDDALLGVVDPELALSILDVGLVLGVTVSSERLHVLLTMTSAACPVTDLIVEEVEDALHRVASPHMQLDVELVWEPEWTADRMSARGKAFMGW